MSRCLRYSRASRTSDRVRPNLERKPALDFHRPAPRVASLTANADDRPDVQLLAMAHDRLELGELLDDRDHLLADLAGEHRHLDELVVLEPVADDRRIRGFGQGEHGQQLGLGAGLEPEMVRLAKVEDLLDDVPLLVHLDRIDAAITALVVVLANGRAEGVVDLADAMAEDIREAKQDRQLDAALLELIDQLLEVDRLAGVLVGMNGYVPLGVDPEIVLAPVANAVRFQGIIDLPRIGESMFGTLRHSRNPPYPQMDKRRVSRKLAVRSTSIFQNHPGCAGIVKVGMDAVVAAGITIDPAARASA